MAQNRYKVLLVEDETNIRNLVATMLETAGYQTILADSCSGAKILYASYLPDLVILDLGFGTFTLVRRVTKIATGAGIHRRD